MCPKKNHPKHKMHSPYKRMYQKVPQENWLQKGVKVVDQGLAMYNTGKALYHAGSTIAAGFRAVAPMMGMML